MQKKQIIKYDNRSNREEFRQYYILQQNLDAIVSLLLCTPLYYFKSFAVVAKTIKIPYFLLNVVFKGLVTLRRKIYGSSSS